MTWTLRRRLVVVVILMGATVAGVIGLVSTLVLQQNLVHQLDQRVQQANERGFYPQVPPTQTTDPGLLNDDEPYPSEDSVYDESSEHGDLPPLFDRPGSEVGMISVVVWTDTVVGAYADVTGDLQLLTLEQTQVLQEVPADGLAHTIHVAGLGEFRAMAMVSDGVVQVTALPLEPVEELVRSFVWGEVMVSTAGLAAVALVASWLVGRELRPLVRVAAIATRVAHLPLGEGEVLLAERVAPADTDPATEVGQVGAAVNQMLNNVGSSLTARYESEQQVRQFVADASHELRTPLASIRGYTELIRRSPDELPAPAQHALDRVEAEAQRMTTLVSDLLLLARLDAGRPLERQAVDLTELAIDAIADAHAAGPDHQWGLSLPPADEDEESEPLTVLGDSDRLRQVLANLLSNARLHTPAQTTVTLSVLSENGRVVLRVADDGPGIAADLQPRLFQRFTRGDASRNRAAGSTGLGLAIVAAVVTAHEGTITVQSVPGSTVFEVSFPAV